MNSERHSDAIFDIRCLLLVLALVGLPVDSASAMDDSSADPPSAETPEEPDSDVGKDETAEPEEQLSAEDQADVASAEPIDLIGPGKRPPASLEPLIELAQQARKKFRTKIDAYTCLLVKRETIEGKLESTKYIRLKIRERRVNGDRLLQAQSIYGRFLKPRGVAGREILYVENERDGDILVRRGGITLPNLTLEIDPNGRLARQESNHSIVELGIRPLVEQILERMQSDTDPDNLRIRYYADAKVDGRPCQHIEVTELERRENSMFKVVKVYIDEELKLPVFFASYAWPDQPGDPPVLQEQYAITRIDLGAKLSDLDFDRTNPQYKFRKE